MGLKTDDRPLRVRILEALGKYPDGIGSTKLSAILGDPSYAVSSVISKISMYGGPIEKIGPTHGPKTRWRLKRKENGHGERTGGTKADKANQGGAADARRDHGADRDQVGNLER